MHCGIIKVCQQVDLVQNPVCSFYNNNYYIIITLVVHSLCHTAATDLIKIRNNLAAPKQRSSGLELATVPMYRVNGRSASLSYLMNKCMIA